MLVQLTFGDWSDDGHGKSETRVFESNKSASELVILSKNLPIKFDGFCADYEDNLLPKKILDKFTKAGFDWSTALAASEYSDWVPGDQDCLDKLEADDGIYIWIDELISLWEHYMKFVYLDLNLELVELDADNLSIGYGLWVI